MNRNLKRMWTWPWPTLQTETIPKLWRKVNEVPSRDTGMIGFSVFNSLTAFFKLILNPTPNETAMTQKGAGFALLLRQWNGPLNSPKSIIPKKAPIISLQVCCRCCSAKNKWVLGSFWLKFALELLLVNNSRRITFGRIRHHSRGGSPKQTRKLRHNRILCRISVGSRLSVLSCRTPSTCN